MVVRGALEEYLERRERPRLRSVGIGEEDLPLGFADANAVCCAERNAGKVLTLDLRHLGVVAGEGRISLLP